MISKTYKLSKRDHLNLESIESTLEKLLPTLDEANKSIKENNGKYIREFNIEESAEFGFCLEWLRHFIEGSN